MHRVISNKETGEPWIVEACYEIGENEQLEYQGEDDSTAFEILRVLTNRWES